MALNVSGRAAKVDREKLLRKQHDNWHKIGLRDREHVVSQVAADIVAVTGQPHGDARPEDRSSAWIRGRWAGNAYADADRDVWLAVP
jgi:hypothetical protein